MSPQDQHGTYDAISPTPDDERKVSVRLKLPNPVLEGGSHSTLITMTWKTLNNLRPITRSFYLLLPVTLYTFMIVFSWVLTCILTHRPMTTARYGEWIGEEQYTWRDSFQERYVRNERWYTAVRFIQAAAGVLTIPLTTSVCSYAAVVYLQHTMSRSTPDITLRQMMSLADRGWTDLSLLIRILMNPIRNWKRYGCAFLVHAIVLHILGGIISPIQQIYLSTVAVKTPTGPYAIRSLLDIPDKFGEPEFHEDQESRVVVATRKAIEAVSSTEIPSEMWSSSNTTCVFEGENEYLSDMFSPLCTQAGLSWAKVSLIPEVFLAQLPNGFNTGLIRQFAPRFNSTASYDNVTASDFPANCAARSGSLSFDYVNVTMYDEEDLIWALHACMPADMRIPPWKNTRDRQDFTEELYLNVTVSKPMQDKVRQFVTNAPTSEYFRIQVRTTAGYYELPNYMNGQKAGPLLNKLHGGICGDDCIRQGNLPHASYYSGKRSFGARDSHPTSPQSIPNKGPLLTTAIALFGNGSYLENQARVPGIYVTDNSPGTDCVDIMPFGQLFSSSDKKVNKCVRRGSSRFVNKDIATFLMNFRVDLEAIKNAFEVSAYLANRVWMNTQGGEDLPSLTVSYDLGKDSQRPSISTTGVIVLSTIIAVFLALLWATTIYAIVLPRWSEKLDAFALMRLGASIHEKVPLRLTGNHEQIPILDTTPGWVGDSTGDEKFGHVALGGPTRLFANRYYDCYDRPSVVKRQKRSLATSFDIQQTE